MSLPPHIVILGAGFAALTAARELRRRAPQARITLVAPKANSSLPPASIWIPTGLRRAADLILPLGQFLKDHQVKFFRGASAAWPMADAQLHDRRG